MGFTWRDAGMSYLKYVNICAALTRKAVREPLRKKLQLNDDVFFRVVKMTPEGKLLEKAPIESFGTKII